MKCRHCKAELQMSLIDLGSAPPSNAYLTEDSLSKPEPWFPLRVLVCEECWLVQTEDFAQADELFNADYAYFSAFSNSWLSHCEAYVDEVVDRFALDRTSYVVEVAANDGYLLQYVQRKSIPCLGVEPTASTASAARKKGIPIIEEFFGVGLAEKMLNEGHATDLMMANNVLAHVPEINDFVKGFSILLKPDGVVTFEFPHLLQLLSENQFDTIYHEHFSYLSLIAISRIFKANGLSVFDVEELPTHGGSIRVYAQRLDSGSRPASEGVGALIEKERAAGLSSKSGYTAFQQRAEEVKNDLLRFLLEAKEQGKKVVAYGAAAKGNTLINFAGIRPDLIEYVVDRNPAKQGKFMPGSRIPIVDESRLVETKPDYVLVLPWNLKDEISEQISYIRDWGAQKVVAIPTLSIFS